MSEEEKVSKSKQKREQRAADAKAAKHKKNWESILSWSIGIILAVAVIGVIGAGIYTSVINPDTPIVSNSDFSSGLTEEGYIDGAKLSKVDTSYLEKIVVPYSEVEFTAEDCDKEISSFCENLAYYSDDSSLTVVSGSDINLDYVGYVDGEAFEGGSTDGAGTTLVIGSGNYIDNFEDQLVGYHPGDDVTVNVTFPDVYENNPDLAGKQAVFECTINGIKTVPEITDEIVATYLADYASNVEELRAVLTEEGLKGNIVNYLSTYINENSSTKGVPNSYINSLQGIKMYSDESYYNYMNNYFYSYFGSAYYTSFNDYTGMTDDEYSAYLKTVANQTAGANITLEAYFKENNLQITDSDYNSTLSTYGTSAESTYGVPFLKQETMKSVVLYHLADIVTVEGK